MKMNVGKMMSRSYNAENVTVKRLSIQFNQDNSSTSTLKGQCGVVPSEGRAGWGACVLGMARPLSLGLGRARPYFRQDC